MAKPSFQESLSDRNSLAIQQSVFTFLLIFSMVTRTSQPAASCTENSLCHHNSLKLLSSGHDNASNFQSMNFGSAHPLLLQSLSYTKNSPQCKYHNGATSLWKVPKAARSLSQCDATQLRMRSLSNMRKEREGWLAGIEPHVSWRALTNVTVTLHFGGCKLLYLRNPKYVKLLLFQE